MSIVDDFDLRYFGFKLNDLEDLMRKPTYERNTKSTLIKGNTASKCKWFSNESRKYKLHNGTKDFGHRRSLDF